MRIPVLTYHSVNIIENTYRDSDHIALAADLETLARGGWRVVPPYLAAVVVKLRFRMGEN